MSRSLRLSILAGLLLVASQAFGQASFSCNLQAPTTYYYRVRTVDCGGAAGPFSQTASTVIQPPPALGTSGGNVTAPYGVATPVSMLVSIPAPSAKQSLDSPSYTATPDRTFLTVTPLNGSLPATVTVKADPRTLPVGTSSGTVSVTSAGATVANIPLSITLVTPVTPGARSSSQKTNTLIIPIITHVNGAAATFLSDVRLTNAATPPATYGLSMTPTRTDGTQKAVSTQLTVAGGQTVALGDIANTFFGFGATGLEGDQGFGSLEIRPTDLSSILNFVSSRTFATTAAGTFGQFIPGMKVSSFATNNGGDHGGRLRPESDPP